MPHRVQPHHLFMTSAETDQAMRALALQLSAFLVVYRDTAPTMLQEVGALLDGDGTTVSEGASELYTAMAGVPPREQRRILECLEILRSWLANGIVDVTRAQSVAIYIGPPISANDADGREEDRGRITAVPKS